MPSTVMLYNQFMHYNTNQQASKDIELISILDPHVHLIHLSYFVHIDAQRIDAQRIDTQRTSPRQ